MEELKLLLINIEDSYYDFVESTLGYSKDNEKHIDLLINYIKGNPNVKTSDVIKFISDQPDFMDDVVLTKAI